MDELTHLDMAEAVADVAIGACPVARWSSGEGWTTSAERDARGRIVLRTFNPAGQCVVASTMSPAEVRSYVTLASRSAA